MCAQQMKTDGKLASLKKYIYLKVKGEFCSRCFSTFVYLPSS